MVDSLNLKIDDPQRLSFPLGEVRNMLSPHFPPKPLEVLTVLLHINLRFKMKKFNYQERDLLFKT